MSSFVFYARVDFKNFNFIGLPDSYSDYEACILEYSDFGRVAMGESAYDPTQFNFKIENALKYSQVPLRLKFVNEVIGLTDGSLE